MAPPKKRTLPKPLPDGFILTDMEKKRWRLGQIIGQGGFGLIYLASLNVERPVPANSEYVIKVEYLENGPLFSELKFYQRAAKRDMIQTWMKNKKLDFLGIPTYWGSGQAEHNGRGYRFMAMDRLGSDLQKICDSNGGRFKPNTVLQFGQRLVDVLEYIHENEYVHSDIKAANLMQGHTDQQQIYLADYGLSFRYCPDSKHKEYKENPKKGHDGTIEYTSLDAHRGVAPSRRSDLQILGFCLLHWLCGRLPWDHLLQSPDLVQEAKTRFMENLPKSVLEMSSDREVSDKVAKFLCLVNSLQYQNKPDYRRLRELLSCSKTRLDFDPPSRPDPGSSSRTEDPLPRDNKKTGRGQGSSKVGAMDKDEEQKRRPKQIPARYLRGPPIYKPAPTAEAVEVDEDVEEKPKRIPSRYLRGPPISKPQAENKVDQDEQRTKPKQIPEKYLRGPPIRPKDPDTEAMTRARRWGPTVHSNTRSHFHRDEHLWRDLYRPHVEVKGQEPRDAPGLVPRGRRLLWVCAGACFLIALATMSF